MLLFIILRIENRNPFIPAVLTALSKGALCITSFTTCGRFPICITFCSGNVNKRFRKIPLGIINTFVEQATNRAVPTKKSGFTPHQYSIQQEEAIKECNDHVSFLFILDSHRESIQQWETRESAQDLTESGFQLTAACIHIFSPSSVHLGVFILSKWGL